MSLNVWMQDDVMRVILAVSRAQTGVFARSEPCAYLFAYRQGSADTLAALCAAFGIEPTPMPELRQLLGTGGECCSAVVKQ